MDSGVQLFGVLANTDLPAAEVLQKIREAGYTHVEPCLALDPAGAFEKMIWPQDRFEGYMEMIVQQGLKIHSVHIFGLLW